MDARTASLRGALTALEESTRILEYAAIVASPNVVNPASTGLPGSVDDLPSVRLAGSARQAFG